MSVEPTAFRAAFPEFGDAVAYPDAAVSLWLDQANVDFAADRFGARASTLVMLATAHNLALGKLGASGSGSAFAPVASKSVGPVSKSMDTSAVTTQGAGVWNATSYGQRLWTLLRPYVTGGFYRPSARAGQISAAERAGWPSR